MTGQAMVIDDVAARRSAAANKAWATRRAQGWTPGNFPAKSESSKTTAEQALEAFEREAESDAPDWHRAALKLKQALGQGSPKALARRSSEPRAPRPLALPPSRWHDYPVDRVSSFSIRTDILVVTFADGEIVRRRRYQPRASRQT